MIPPVLLHIGSPERGRIWTDVLPKHVPGLEVRQWPDLGDPTRIGYVAAWTLPEGLLAELPNLRFLMSIGAGVDQLDLGKIPADLPLLRTVDPEIAAGMTEFVVAQVLGLHRDLPQYRASASLGAWEPRQRVRARDRHVGIMGMGNLGRSALQALAPFGFSLSGWAASRHMLPGIACYAGDAELGDFLRTVDILICLLPLTPATRGILNRDLFLRLPRGAAIVNVARGDHLVERDLLDAIADGQIGHAVLDVAATEPLPAESPLWRNPRIDVTPHIASSTHPLSGALCVAEAITADLEGRPLPGAIDRTRKY